MGKISSSLDAEREDQRMELPEAKAAVPAQSGSKKLLISVNIETHTALRIRAITERKTLEAVSREILERAMKPG